MQPVFDNMDLFCRINVQSDLAFEDFVASVAQHAGGSRHMNVVQNGALDISIHKNDIFDPLKSRSGEDRWLYFRYTLEIDPIPGTAPGGYVAAIGALLKSLWSSALDAVVSCDFEDRLPRLVPLPTADPIAFLDACARIVYRYWAQARFEDPTTGKRYPSYQEIPFGGVKQLLVYPNSEAEVAPNSMLRLIRSPQSILAVIDGSEVGDRPSLLASMVTDMSRMEFPRYREAA
jgi:hypothetical protein